MFQVECQGGGGGGERSCRKGEECEAAGVGTRVVHGLPLVPGISIFIFGIVKSLLNSLIVELLVPHF